MNTDVDHPQEWIQVGSIGPLSVHKKNVFDPSHNILVRCRALNDDQQYLLRFDPHEGLLFTAENFTQDGYMPIY